MLRFTILALSILGLTACASSPSPSSAAKPPDARAALHSGSDLRYVDSSVRPQDDLYRYLNGKWLRTYQLPPDKGAVGSFTNIEDTTRGAIARHRRWPRQRRRRRCRREEARRSVRELHGRGTTRSAGSRNRCRRNLQQIDAINDMHALPALIAHMNRMGAGAPYGLFVNHDARDSTQYAVILTQSGLGMPDRDYYLTDDAKLKDARAKYQVHIEKMLGHGGRFAGGGECRRDPQARNRARARSMDPG